MEYYYIKDGGIWSGPMSKNEFEALKHDKDRIIYWKPEFCVNRVLHPLLCEHSKTWNKPPAVKEKPAEKIKSIPSPKQPLQKEVIFHAEPLDSEEEKITPPQEEEKNKETPEKKSNSIPEPKQNDKADSIEKTDTTPGFTFKLVIIIIGFLLVFGAGFYANSKLSVMFYQDIIIQESVKNIEYYTRDMMNETKEVKTDIDSLNATMTKEIKMLKKQMRELEAKIIELKYRE